MHTANAKLLFSIFNFNYFLHAFTLFLLIGSLFALFIGIGILLQSHLIFRFIAFANQRFSTRVAIKSVEVQRNIEAVLYSQRKVLGTLVIIGAVIALVLLLNPLTEAKVLMLISGGSPTIGQILVASSVKWLLVTGNAICLGVGIMLHFYPERLAKIEAVVNQWVSVRKHTAIMEKMYMGVDSWIIKHPLISGIFIIFLSLNIAVSMYTHL